MPHSKIATEISHSMLVPSDILYKGRTNVLTLLIRSAHLWVEQALLARYYKNRFPKSSVTFKSRYSKETGLDISVGSYSISSSPIYIHPFNPNLHLRLIIGKFTHIGNNLSLIMSKNHTPEYVSNNLNSLFLEYPSTELYFKHYRESFGDIEIGNDVWIGNNVTILGGTKIGNGAVIGANSLVTTDVKPFVISGGIPARTIKHRFSSEIVEALDSIAFWNWSEDLIVRNIESFYDVESFVDRFIGRSD